MVSICFNDLDEFCLNFGSACRIVVNGVEHSLVRCEHMTHYDDEVDRQITDGFEFVFEAAVKAVEK